MKRPEAERALYRRKQDEVDGWYREAARQRARVASLTRRVRLLWFLVFSLGVGLLVLALKSPTL